jgi:hypothetical protein
MRNIKYDDETKVNQNSKEYRKNIKREKKGDKQ